MEVLLVDEDNNQFEQAEDGEEQGDDPAQFGDQVTEQGKQFRE